MYVDHILGRSHCFVEAFFPLGPLRWWISLALHILSSDPGSSSPPPKLLKTFQMALESSVVKGFLGRIAKGEPIMVVREDYEVFGRSHAEHGHGERAEVERFL